MEADPTHRRPRVVLRAQPPGDRPRPLRELRGERPGGFAPEGGEGLGRDVLGAAHGGYAVGHRRDRGRRRLEAHALAKGLELGMRAEARHELVTERPEEPEGGGQRRPDLDGAEVQHARARPALEGRGDGDGAIAREDVVVLGAGQHARPAARQDGQRQARRALFPGHHRPSASASGDEASSANARSHT